MDPKDEYTIEREGREIRFAIRDAEGLMDDIDDAIDEARGNGYDSGLSDGREEGYAEAEEELAKPDDADTRINELRLSLYRSIYAGDIEAAEDAANLMAMVDIDRELIWAARAEARKGVRCDE